MNILHEFNPSRFVPGTMRRRIVNVSAGTLLPALVDEETARLVVSGVTADPAFDLPIGGDGVRRTAVQSWFVGEQLKFQLHRSSSSTIRTVLAKAMQVLQEISKEEEVSKDG